MGKNRNSVLCERFGTAAIIPRHSLTWWHGLVTLLVEKDLMEFRRATSNARRTFDAPFLTSQGTDVFNAGANISLTPSPEMNEEENRTSDPKRRFQMGSELRDWRTRMSETSGKPMYVILSEKAVKSIQSIVPRTNEALFSCEGISAYHVGAYGKAIIGICYRYFR
jgi:superfamily II DNA helicase RecQ